MNESVFRAADAALQELLTEAPLAQRVASALVQFQMLNDRLLSQDCQIEVRAAVQAAKDCRSVTGISVQAQAVYTAISRILEAWGHQGWRNVVDRSEYSGS